MEMLKALNGDASIVVVSCPLSVCFSRNMRRKGSMVSNEEIQQAWMTFEPVALNEGYKAIYEWDSLLNKIRRVA
jgi:tRNA uridine 5-carbamoylmethylation protein Kti12